MNLFQRITYGSEHYEAECVLRDELLRQPLGLSLGDEDLTGEKDQWHFGIFTSAGSLEACAVVDPLNEHHAKVRQVAVRADRQRCGLGQELMQAIENHLRQNGVDRVTLHSRKAVLGFYQRLGYQIEGEEFQEVGLPHRKMSKTLAGPS